MKFEVTKIDLFKHYKNNVVDTERVELNLAPNPTSVTGADGPVIVSMEMFAPAGTFSAGEVVDVSYEEEG